MGILEKKKQAFINMLSHQDIKKTMDYKPPILLRNNTDNNEIKYKIYGNFKKNAIEYPFLNSTKTANGITYTDNKDGTITANGTATGRAAFELTSAINYTLPQGKYFLSGCPVGGTNNTYYLYVNVLKKDGNSWKIVKTFYDYGEGVLCDLSNLTYDGITITITIMSGAVLDNAIFKPQLEVGTSATEFEKNEGIGEKTKNLLTYPYENTSGTTSGVQFNINTDGTISVKGTPTNLVSYYLGKVLVTSGETYTLTGIDAEKNLEFLLVEYNSANETTGGSYRDRIITYTCSDERVTYVKIYISIVTQNVEVPETVVKPQLEFGSSATEFEKGGYKLPIEITGKNVFKYPYSEKTKTVNGITFTDNGDGTITVNGTATGRAVFYFSSPLTFSLPQGKYYFSGCPSGGSSTSYRMYINTLIRKGTGWKNVIPAVYDIGLGGVLDIRDVKYDGFTIALEIAANTTMNNVLFKPMIEVGDKGTNYEKYEKKGNTNIYIPKLLNYGKNIDYIDFSEQKVIYSGEAQELEVPAINLGIGNNTISVLTEVSPSRMYINYNDKI